MDTFTKIRILQQLSTWTLNNADRIREKMPEQKDVEQTNWVSGFARPHSCATLMNPSVSILSDGIRKTVPTLFSMTIAYTAAPILPYPLTRRRSPSPNQSPSLRKPRALERASAGGYQQHLPKAMPNRRRRQHRIKPRKKKTLSAE